jgi:hypothetical protein
MLNWNYVEKARLHREDLLREATADRRSQEVHPQRREPLWPLVALIVVAHHWLEAVLPRTS